MIDASSLPAETKTATGKGKKNGLIASFHPSGALKEFAFYRNGSCDTSWALSLEEDETEGTAVLRQGSGGSADRELFFHGSVTQWNAWTDNAPSITITFEEWVREWIRVIAEQAKKR